VEIEVFRDEPVEGEIQQRRLGGRNQPDSGIYLAVFIDGKRIGAGHVVEAIALLVALDLHIPAKPVMEHRLAQTVIASHFARMVRAVMHFHMDDHRRLRSEPESVLAKAESNYNF